MTTTVQHTQTLVTVECTCGIAYAIPSSLHQQLLDHRGSDPETTSIYCPLGHRWHYTGKSEATKEREQRAAVAYVRVGNPPCVRPLWRSHPLRRRARKLGVAVARFQLGVKPDHVAYLTVQAALRAKNDQLEAEQRAHAATKGKLTKTKNRIGNGVCPCCNRHFTNVDRHMKTQHPDYTGAKGKQ